MEIVNINSKTAAVKVGSSFKGTEDEVKKIATDIGQFDNVANYRIDNGYVVFAFDNAVKIAVDYSPSIEGNEEMADTVKWWINNNAIMKPNQLTREYYLSLEPQDGDENLHPDQRCISVDPNLLKPEEWSERHGRGYVLDDGAWYDPVQKDFFGVITVD